MKGGFAEIKIDNGFKYDPKNTVMIEGYNRFCDGKLYCEEGYIPSGCNKCVNEADQMRRTSTSAYLMGRGGRRRRKTRRQGKTRRQRKTRRNR